MTVTQDELYNHDDKQDHTDMKSASCNAQDWRTPIRHSGRWFKDNYGRTLLMRGINLGGSSKLPTYPYSGSTHLYDEKLFWDHRGVSFVNRPFPLEDAHEHFSRLRAWGLTFIRLIVTWESLEHSGPGIYDEAYIDYLRQLIEMMPAYGLKCLIDPHQDTWSRFSGGSGAPGWTFEVAGMNMRSFKETGAAYVHNTNVVPGDPLPMVWPTNYTKLAACTMFTLFFAGDTFAPKRLYEGQTIQKLLNTSFINAYQHLATRLLGLEAIMGFEVMNEPHPGYIGLNSLKEFDPISNLIFGDSPTPLQSFALGSGIPQTVGVYIKSWPFPTKRSHDRVINESKTSAWIDGQSCVWKEHNVWGVNKSTGEPELLDSAYFSKHPSTGVKVDFYKDFYMPFVNSYAKAIQSVKSDWYCFVEPLANEKSPVLTETDHHHNMVFAPHWYDLNCVFYKKFDGRMTHDVQSLQNGGNVLTSTYFGRKGAKKNYRGQIRNIRENGLKSMGEKPCVLGEVGIPMDLNQKIGFETGDYTSHIHFLDAVIYALETNLVNFTLWNYDVCNDHEFGDHWNGENFSLYSNAIQPSSDAKSCPLNISPSAIETAENDLHDQLHEGGRALDAALRPYASKVAGTPETSEFDMDNLEYTLIFKPFTEHEIERLKKEGYYTSNPLFKRTEIFVPNHHFRNIQISVQVTHGDWDYVPEKQTLYHFCRETTHTSVTIQLKAVKEKPTDSPCTIM
ncbi:glycoside hydrolase family 5 protein [Phycomyces blakesleeanus]|uniref:Glycoside hydrolase family 5 protein n=2 Tax=Phycomyces blakesleeanus TaxID=4837 RepID=A0A167QNR3_PHYB8|nr:glycoside hydrolase family 5 protein [Phycomyces blakesleeanus NRRL 1555(-)]OAD79977.1 glycoside hydrolase family 5 protein [Phycomyces blakesleeanus NRRL 1555(-)]|eukprot:XP_018298017.1 glycoside hydrolase family 5 protein [Phycomyces blakesleeanus NRRL 1555(-)]